MAPEELRQRGDTARFDVGSLTDKHGIWTVDLATLIDALTDLTKSRVYVSTPDGAKPVTEVRVTEDGSLMFKMELAERAGQEPTTD